MLSFILAPLALASLALATNIILPAYVDPSETSYWSVVETALTANPGLGFEVSPGRICIRVQFTDIDWHATDHHQSEQVRPDGRKMSCLSCPFHHVTDVICISSPHSGPSSSTAPAGYSDLIKTLRAANSNVKILGYVPTGYGKTDAGTINGYVCSGHPLI